MGQISKIERELLEWFAARLGDHIQNEKYQKLYPEFARIVTGYKDIYTIDDVLKMLERRW